MFTLKEEKDGIVLTGLDRLSISKIFDCGQCFRFDPSPAGGVTGIAHGRRVNIRRDGDALRIDGITESDFTDVW